MFVLDTCRMSLIFDQWLTYFDHINVHRGLTKDLQCHNFELLLKKSKLLYLGKSNVAFKFGVPTIHPSKFDF